MSQRIEDYAVIGDLHSAALVGIDGSIDWLCLPHFDSASCFARLLGDEDHGFWKISPAGGPEAIVATRRWYRPDTLVVETEYDTKTGTVRVTDCMPVREGHPHLVRSVEGVSGTVEMHMELAVRFDYGEVVPWVTSNDGLVRLTAGPDSVALWHRVDATGKDLRTVADFTVTENQRFPFTLGVVSPRTKSRRRRWTATTRCISPRPTGRNGRRSVATRARTRKPWCAPSSRSRP